MPIFNKKNAPKAQLTYFHLIFNLTQIKSWKLNPRLISPVNKWNSTDETKDLLITLLPGEEFLFHHQEINQFSPSLGGYLNFDEANPTQLEWNTEATYFYVMDDSSSEGREIIFLAPMEEITYLLNNNHVKPQTLYNDNAEGNVIDIEKSWENGYCKQIFKKTALQDGVVFRNELVEFSAVCVGSNNQVQYWA